MNVLIDSVISEGYIYGPVVKKENIASSYAVKSVEEERAILKNAINASLDDLHKLDTDNSLKEYVGIQIMMISDPALIKAAFKKIESGLSAVKAITITIDELSEGFKNSNSMYLQSRVNDFDDIKIRIVNKINPEFLINNKEKHILVVDKLYPSILIENHDLILGVIAKEGGFSSHSAIIARSLDIPYVIVNKDIDCDSLIIDTRKNLLITSPSEEEIQAFNSEYKERLQFDKYIVDHPNYNFYANVASNDDIKKAMDYGFDGIGLYRTEMIFMNLDRPYTFDEQVRIYTEAVNLMGGKTITFRTFDIGDDKNLSYLKCNKKSIDNYINNKDIFETQIRAMLIASSRGNTRIMFPMIESHQEFLVLKNWVIEMASRMKIKCPPIGMMLECKNALETITDFTDVDFISVGTNDLTKSLYNIDRESNVDPEDFAEDLVSKIEPAVMFARKLGIQLSVCGELAAIKKNAIRFYNIGIRSLSVNPSSVRMLNLAYSEYINSK